MMQKRVNNGRFNASQLFAVLFAIFLIFSSCSTKRGLKSLLDLPVSTTKTVLHLENDKLVSNNSNCLSCKDLQVLTVDNSDTSLLKILSPATLQDSVFLSFLVPNFNDEPTEYTYGPPEKTGDVPIYILFKKLILYNA
ncbi:MAG TPA: hypothetical protein VK050_04955 [Flavobacteriaceae bacterium]|nr:hypothetical protein [Flavobacteriaceae bacterium]